MYTALFKKNLLNWNSRKMESESGPSSPPSLSSVTTKDEFEGIELVAEFDANALWELLKEEDKAPMEIESIHFNNPNSSSAFETTYWSLNDDNENDMVDWFRIIEETSIPCSEMGLGGWCMEEMSQILEIRDYSFSHITPILSDEEVGYIGGLWHHT